MNPAMRDKLLNFVLFQIGWFACVLSAAALQPWIGALIALVIIALHLWRATLPAHELLLLIVAVLIGAIWDSLLVMLGLLGYPAGTLIHNTAPYWIIVLWALFATTLNVSLQWLKEHLAMAALLGAIAGPLAYAGGAGLGAVELVDINMAFAALALGWALFTPLLLVLATRFNGYAARTAGELAWK